MQNARHGEQATVRTPAGGGTARPGAAEETRCLLAEARDALRRGATARAVLHGTEVELRRLTVDGCTVVAEPYGRHDLAPDPGCDDVPGTALLTVQGGHTQVEVLLAGWWHERLDDPWAVLADDRPAGAAVQQRFGLEPAAALVVRRVHGRVVTEVALDDEDVAELLVDAA